MSIFRPAVPADLNRLVALDQSVRNANGEAARTVEAALAAWVAASECHVAEQGGEIVAYGVLHNHFFHVPFIDTLIVGARWRRQGIGRDMVRYLAALARPPKLWTSTNLSNQPMQALLAAEGFVMSGFIEGLDEGDPELIYRKLLAPLPQD